MELSQVESKEMPNHHILWVTEEELVLLKKILEKERNGLLK